MTPGTRGGKARTPGPHETPEFCAEWEKRRVAGETAGFNGARDMYAQVWHWRDGEVAALNACCHDNEGAIDAQSAEIARLQAEVCRLNADVIRMQEEVLPPRILSLGREIKRLGLMLEHTDTRLAAAEAERDALRTEVNNERHTTQGRA